MNTHRGLYIVGILALVWNVIGDAAYLMQVTMNTVDLAKTDPYQAKLFETMPAWAWACYAVGVWGGTLASICLLMKRSAAVPIYAISLIAILAQFGRTFFLTDLLAVRGWTTTLFPAVIVILAIAQLLYARAMKARNVLK